MLIREAVAEDAEGVARVHVDTWRTTYRGIVPQAHLDALSHEKRTAGWRASFTSAEHRRTKFTLVAEEGGRIIGFAAGGTNRLTPSDYPAELYAIYLDPSRQRAGIGRRLTTDLAGRFLTQGWRSMLVWVLAANPSRAFYERLGGRPAGSKTIEIGGATLGEVAYGWPDLVASFTTPSAPRPSR